MTQALTSFKDNTDNDVYKSYKYRLSLIEKYLPSMMSEEEVVEAVKNILSNLEGASFGEKMKAVMSELKGKADGKLIQKAVKSF